jgi:hypothetical protein
MEINLEIIRHVLGWCAVMNFAILMLWFLVYTIAPGLIYNTHGKLLNISNERITEIHYSGMLFFKLSIFLFNIAPYLALRIVG